MISNSSDSVMAEAFRAAGFETPYDKLRRLMVEAITAPGPGRGLSELSLRRFKMLLLAEEDAALVWLLWETLGGPMNLFYEVLAQIRKGKEFGRGAQAGASSNAGTVDETSWSLKPNIVVSQSAVPATTTERATHAPPGHGVSGMQTVIHWGQQSWLRRVTVANKPVATMTLIELEAGIKTNGRVGRFLNLLRDSWPAYTNVGIVSDYVTDEDGDRLYEKASGGG